VRSNVSLLTNRISSVFKDIKYSHLSITRALSERAHSDNKALISDKSKYFETLLDNHIQDYESKLKQKDELIEQLRSNNGS